MPALGLGVQTARKRLDDLSLSVALADRTLAKGIEQLEQGQIAYARGSFLYVYQKGLAAGAFMMAATFDPDELKRLPVMGMPGDKDEARLWYERARDLGHPEANGLLRRLEQSVRY